MECPACGNQLQVVSMGDIRVDVCGGHCGGIWFDQYELRKFDEPHESVGELLLEVERNESIVVDHEKRRSCPRCVDIVMMRHFFSVKHQVEVDECPRCAGFWLDAGELGAIRDEFKDEAERGQKAAASFGSLFDDQIAAQRQETEKKTERARAFARMFRFILPSYYIPGKQKGGAY